MKLYQMFLDNGLPYEDNNNWTELVVCKNESDAEKRAKELNEENFNEWERKYSDVTYVEVVEVDGYKIKFFKE